MLTPRRAGGGKGEVPGLECCRLSFSAPATSLKGMQGGKAGISAEPQASARKWYEIVQATGFPLTAASFS